MTGSTEAPLETAAEVGVSEATAVVTEWVAAAGVALENTDASALADRFLPDSWWRDLLALTWDIRTYRGQGAIEEMLADRLRVARPGDLEWDDDKVEVIAGLDGTPMIQAFVRFEVDAGPARGVLKLCRDASGEWKAWTFLSSLEQVRGAEERETQWTEMLSDSYRVPRERRERFGVDRSAASQFHNESPTVLIVGAGHFGVSLAARLDAVGISNLVVDRENRLGDNWRHRYASLQLHDPYFVNHFPYLPFPVSAGWPVMLPKDKVADWIEFYASLLDLKVWTQAAVLDGSYDHSEKLWTVRIDRQGSERVLQPRHVVLATGVARIPDFPKLQGLEEFEGEIVHSSAFGDGKDYAGKRAVVVGTGNSGHDIAQDLFEQGADVTIVQRTPTYVMSTGNGTRMTYANFEPGRYSLEDADLLYAATPYPLGSELSPQFAELIAESDRELIDGLEAVGFRTNRAGIFDVSIQRTSFGGFYIDQGCAQLIIEGRIKVKRGGLAGFAVGNELVFDDGSTLEADLVVLATGFRNMRESAREIFGDSVADRCAEVFFPMDQDRLEFASVWRDSGHPRLWFHAGSFAWSRFYSKTLAQQILGIERGLFEQPSAIDFPLVEA